MSFYYFQDNEFSDVYISTIGVDFVSTFKISLQISEVRSHAS